MSALRGGAILIVRQHMSHSHASSSNSHAAGDATTEGAWAQQAEAALPERRLKEEIERSLAFGLAAAPSVIDRSISTFVRGELPHFAGETGTFLKCPFIEDVNQVKDAEVAIFGAPLDTGTTYRPGTRFGPQGIRRATNLFGTYSFEYGVDLREQLNVVDIGDIFTIPANLEKSFDQISRGISHVVGQGVFPVVLGGDHSIGYPTVRGLAEWVAGPIGIIHLNGIASYVALSRTGFESHLCSAIRRKSCCCREHRSGPSFSA